MILVTTEHLLVFDLGHECSQARCGPVVFCPVSQSEQLLVPLLTGTSTRVCTTKGSDHRRQVMPPIDINKAVISYITLKGLTSYSKVIFSYLTSYIFLENNKITQITADMVKFYPM